MSGGVMEAGRRQGRREGEGQGGREGWRREAEIGQEKNVEGVKESGRENNKDIITRINTNTPPYWKVFTGCYRKWAARNDGAWVTLVLGGGVHAACPWAVRPPGVRRGPRAGAPPAGPAPVTLLVRRCLRGRAWQECSKEASLYRPNGDQFHRYTLSA